MTHGHSRDHDDEVAAVLAAARKVVALTGAGVSAESGVPTFRDAQTGLWARFKPEELATPEAFAHDPALVWRWYRWRRELVSRAEPNAGHRALVELETLCPALTVITQNVDGLHQRAGSRVVIEIHGNIARTRCSRASCALECDTDDRDVPLCPACGAPARPDVVWFGEAIPAQALEQAYAALEDCDVLLSIGTSALVYPAAGFPAIAQARGSRIVEINPRSTPLSEQADFVVRGTSAVVLPQLVSAVRRLRAAGSPSQ